METEILIMKIKTKIRNYRVKLEEAHKHKDYPECIYLKGAIFSLENLLIEIYAS